MAGERRFALVTQCFSTRPPHGPRVQFVVDDERAALEFLTLDGRVVLRATLPPAETLGDEDVLLPLQAADGEGEFGPVAGLIIYSAGGDALIAAAHELDTQEMPDEALGWLGALTDGYVDFDNHLPGVFWLQGRGGTVTLRWP